MSFFTIDNPAVILETVKVVKPISQIIFPVRMYVHNIIASAIMQVEAVGTNKALVVRLYEAFGSHTSTTLRSQLPFKTLQRYGTINSCIYIAHFCLLGAVF